MAPIISIFFLWGLGTGAQQLARPLFAFSFGVPIFLVTLIESSNALARIISAPTTGFLTDRFGRKPLVIAGVTLRGATTFIEFFRHQLHTVPRLGVHWRVGRDHVGHQLPNPSGGRGRGSQQGTHGGHANYLLTGWDGHGPGGGRDDCRCVQPTGRHPVQRIH
jgi:hypothetical protein